MTVSKLQYSSGNAASTTTSSSMTNSDTAVPLTSTTNFSAAPTPGEGMMLIDEGAASEELAYGTGLSGGSVTTPLANRGLEGGSAQAHSVNASVKGVLTAGMWNNMITALLNVLVQSSGALDTTKVVDLTTAQTLTNKTLTSPKVGTAIGDTNGNIIIRTPATASAVNDITVTNAATGANPTISATGDDSTAALGLKGKSAGIVATGEYDNGNTSTAQTIKGTNGDSQLSTVTGNVTYTFSNFTAGQKVVLRIVEDGTGGHTITLPTVKWPGGTAGTFTTTASAINLLAIYYDGTNFLVQLAANFS